MVIPRWCIVDYVYCLLALDTALEVITGISVEVVCWTLVHLILQLLILDAILVYCTHFVNTSIEYTCYLFLLYTYWQDDLTLYTVRYDYDMVQRVFAKD